MPVALPSATRISWTAARVPTRSRAMTATCTTSVLLAIRVSCVGPAHRATARNRCGLLVQPVLQAGMGGAELSANRSCEFWLLHRWWQDLYFPVTIPSIQMYCLG